MRSVARRAATGGGLVGLALLAGCAAKTPTPKPFDVALAGCVAGTGVEGQYAADPSVRGTNGLPLVRAGFGGTSRGEILLNACVEQEIRAAGVTVAPPKAKPAKAGKLGLPTQYVLLPGDAALWDTLTRAQQERALQFLKDGSTIRSSLILE